MKTKSPYQIVARALLCALLALAGLTAAPKVQAANGTWTNLPASSIWTNVLNWNGGSVPGTINNVQNNGTDNSSIALFTNAIVTYGGAANPVIPDDATIANGKARMLGQLNFDGPNCGAYVFYSPSPYAAQTADLPETGVISLCVGGTTAATNGSYIGATVTTPQNFLIPVQIRLPSSTTGVYGFTNNATSPLATYFFNNLFLYPGATSRALTFVLAGSNTGTNTIATLAQSVNQSTASCGVRKEGSGKWILSGANTFRAASPMNINDGTLIVKDPGAFGLATTATINSNALLQIDGVTLTTAAITLQLNGTVQMNGSAMINGITVGNPVNTSVTVATTSASDVLTIGDTVNKVTGGSATTVLHFTGSGTIVLDAANNYVGKFSLDTGTNQLSDAGALGSAANYNLSAGAVLDLTPFGATGYILTSKALRVRLKIHE